MVTENGYSEYEIEKPPDTPWTSRVRYSANGTFAYRPGRGHCRTREAAEAGRTITNGEVQRIAAWDDEDEWLFVFDQEQHDVEDVVARLRHDRHGCEPDYVLFANPLFANPLFANPLFANPLFANPLFANPLFANPLFANNVAPGSVFANPLFANRVYSNIYVCDGIRPSTARPAMAPEGDLAPYAGTDARDRVIIFDTGISKPEFCPPTLLPLATAVPEWEWEEPDGPTHADGFLNPSSGHGTFIAGLIQALVPNRRILPKHAVASYGDVGVTDLVAIIGKLQSEIDGNTIVNMSFGGYADEEMAALGRAVRRIRRRKGVVVASAGNDATDRQSYPACLPGVVAVAALDTYGPAPYTNYGDWVAACAPGTDLVAPFYEWNGIIEPPVLPGRHDRDDFKHWARWTGSSFAAPVVAAALLRHMSANASPSSHGRANDAVAAIINAPSLLRLRGLGTVVNLAPPEPGCPPFSTA